MLLRIHQVEQPPISMRGISWYNRGIIKIGEQTMNETRSKAARNLWTAIAIFIAGIGLDQLIKYFVRLYLKPVVDVPIINGVLHLHYTENTGAAFSMFQGMGWLLISVTSIVVIAVWWYIIKKRKELPLFLAIVLPLIAAGGVGNQIIDRLRYGYITDFIYFKLINFAVFNFADMCVVIGAILLLIYFIFFYNKKQKETKGYDGTTQT
jgi:signal peptidase II